MAEAEKPIEVTAMEALGKGFDITGDFRLKYAKGTRLVVLDETNKRDIVFPGAGFTIKAVSQDIRLDKGDRIRFKSDVLEFNQDNSPISMFEYVSDTDVGLGYFQGNEEF